jgi:lambda family phage portal protein
MAKWIDNLAGRLGYQRSKPQRRNFQAASIGRLTANWNASQTSVNQDLKMQLNLMRARSRDLVLNNDYGKKFIQMVGTHMVGPGGFNLQVRVTEPDGRPDGLANDAIERAFNTWSKRGVCDVTGKMSFLDIQQLAAKMVARDGECLIRKVYGRASQNPHGFGLQMLSIDRLDVNRNEVLKDGREIRMGVEMTRFGRPVAYHVLVKNPADGVYTLNNGLMYERIPADEIYHLFVPYETEQIRGVPWMHTAILRLQNLGGFEEAAVIAARVGASKMGFFTSEDGDGTALADGTDANGNLIKEADPGIFDVLPPGYDFKSFSPDYPTANYEPFIKSCLRGIASGLGVAYNTLANDLEGVNFSSIRTGVLEERDNWMVLQNWMIESFLQDVFEQWLRQAMLNSAIIMPNGSPLPITKLEKFNRGYWQGRRWSWVDPLKDAEAAVLLINNSLKSRREVMSEAGRELDDTWAQLAAEQKLAEEMGIELTPDEKSGSDDSADDMAGSLPNDVE